MFCAKCGKEIGESEKFCSGCGASVEEMKNNEPTGEVGTSDLPLAEESMPQEEKKPKKKGKKFLAAIIAAVLVLALGVTAFASPLVNNFLCKTFMSPEKYLRHVTKRTVKSNSENISNFTEIMKNSSVASGASYSLKATIGDSVWDLVEKSDSEAAAYLNWIKEAELKGQVALDGEKIQSNNAVVVNGTELAETKMAIDIANEEMYMSLPGIMDKAVRVPIDGASDVNTREVFDMIEKIQQIVPDEKTANDIIARYTDCVVSQIDKVKKSSDTIEAGGIEQKCTKLKVTITPKTAKNIAKSVLTELKNDKAVRKIVLDAANAAGESISEDDYKDAITSALETIKNSDPDFEDFSFNVWANNVGEIVALGIDKDCIEGFDGEIFAANLQKGNKIGTVIRADVENVSAEFSGSAVQSGGKQNGEYMLKAKGVELLKVSIKDQDIKKIEKGLLSGTVTLQLADGISSILSDLNLSSSELAVLGNLSDLKLELTADQQDKNSFTGSLAVYKGDDLFAKLEVGTNADNSVKYEEPSDYIDADDMNSASPADLGIHFDKIIANLKDAGAPSQITGALELLTKQMSTGEETLTEGDNTMFDGSDLTGGADSSLFDVE